jgi:hypothetical protein
MEAPAKIWRGLLWNCEFYIEFPGSNKPNLSSASRGGNDAAIVCADADIDSAVPRIATLSFLNSGQVPIKHWISSL